MTTPVFQDQRIEAAATRLLRGDIKLLSLDIYDTALGRSVPRAPDVFLTLGVRLEQEGKLINGQKPDSFAAIRYQTEYARRALRQKEFGDREITLEEIYQHFPAHIFSDDLTVAAMIDREVACECDLCFCNPDMIVLARFARENGIKLALITNSYLDETCLRRLLNSCAPDLVEPDGLFISAMHRKGKRDGLMLAMCEAFALSPEQVLHIGDNPVADILAAQELGVPFIDLSAKPDGFDETLTDEHPRQWAERTQCYAQADGDYGLTWLRKQAAFWKRPNNIPSTHEELYRYGVRNVGPLLMGFTGWAASRLRQEKASGVYGLLREGDFLTQLVCAQEPTLPCAKMGVSRLSVALSCFTPDHPAFLEDFLTRRGYWTLGMLMAQLGFTQDQASLIDDPTLTLEQIPASQLTHRLAASPLACELYERSAARRARLLIHLNAIGALDHERLYLLDLGYAATIQRGLQRIFSIEKIPTITHGLYLAAAHVSLSTQLSGGVVEGFLAQNGNPNDFACAFCRSPEVIETSCMPAYGSVIDYAEDGTPLFSPDTMPQNQISEVAVIQQATLDFTRQFLALAAQHSKEPNFTHEGWQRQMRALALRIVAHPSAEEAKLVGHWLADSDMGLSSPRPIVSAGPYQDRLPEITPPELAALPRRDVPWLFGVAATLSQAHTRQVAQIILQHEKPDAFRIPPASTNKDDG